MGLFGNDSEQDKRLVGRSGTVYRLLGRPFVPSMSSETRGVCAKRLQALILDQLGHPTQTAKELAPHMHPQHSEHAHWN